VRVVWYPAGHFAAVLIYPAVCLFMPRVDSSTHRVRVVGYDYLDGLVQLSMQQSVLERPFMTLADLQAGTVLPVRQDRDSPTLDGGRWLTHWACH